MASEKKKNDGPGSGHNEDVSVSSNTSASTAKKGNRTKKVPDATHGLKFESKLLALFCIRALGAGYRFELAKEREDLGGKFDDLIFRYQVPDETPEGKLWRYRYLQAKHKQNEKEKIKAIHLLQDDGDFSLPKYVSSFCMIRRRAEDIHDCIICTNIGVDSNDVTKNGIELESINDQPEDILKFGPQQKTVCYQLKFTEEFRRKAANDWSSDLDRLAKQLQVCVQEKKTTDVRTGIFSSYHVALIKESVIDLKTKKFHQDFVNEVESLSDGAKELRQVLCERVGNDDWKNWTFKLNNTFGKRETGAETENRLPLKIEDADLDAFLDKFVFVGNMPNEEQFEKILQTEDVSKYYPEKDCSQQTIRLMKEIPDALQEAMERGVWLTSKEAKEILLNGVTKMSKEYQTQLEKDVGFNEGAKLDMAKKLNKLLNSSNTIERITSSSPRHTAVKVITAFPILEREHKASISHLVISSRQLQFKEDAERWNNVFQLPNDSGHFLLIVCDDGEQPLQDDPFAKLFLGDEGKAKRNKVMVISRKKAAIAYHVSDEIEYTQLDESFKQQMLSKIVSFQGENETVGRLVGTKPEQLLSSHFLEELLRPGGRQIIIPSFDSTRFEKSLYIKRRMKFAFNEHFIAELANSLHCTVEKLNGECKISSQGQIEWLVDGERREKIWKNITQMNDQTSGKIEEDSHFIQLDEEPTEQPVVIICGVAGTGKSTLLSHYYYEIKRKKPDFWVIRLNLADHCEAISKLDESRPDLIKFLINLINLQVVDSKCPFSRSLLNHRLETGEQIVFMFDGYDEIGEKHQKIAVQLMKSIQKKKGIQLYVTTRTHMAHHLQNELCQLAYYLENFSEADQINYLAKYWTKELKRDEAIKEFSKLLVVQVSETLKDDERAFIGIPLQCRILAECYQKNVGDIVQSNAQQSDELSQKLLALLDDQKFDLVSLYRKLMETKSNIFIAEKMKISTSTSNPNLDFAMKSTIKIIDLRLTKLAVETIVTEPNVLKMFWPTESSADVVQEESHSLNYGLTFSNGNGMRPQFLHRTFAEYFVAKYLYEGFHLDEEGPNKLLENESIRKLILHKILATKQYDGVQVFFDCMVKTLVNKDQEWRNKIDNRQLPDRFKKLAENLFSRLLFFIPPRSVSLLGKVGYGHNLTNAFHFALSNGKGNIFLLLCDCLDARFHRRQVQWALYLTVGKCHSFISAIFLSESKLFKRLINYFDIEPHKPSTCSVIEQLIDAMSPRYSLRMEKNSCWNRDGHQQTMDDLLQFLENHHVAFDQYLIEIKDFGIKRILKHLINHDNYISHLRRFIKLLFESKAYSDDSKLANLLTEVFWSKKQHMTGRIAKTLNILHGLGQSSLIVQRYGGVLSMEPEAFQKIYQPCRPEKEDAIPTDFDTLLESDDYGMTLLHRAAFYGDVDIVEQILARFRQLEDDDAALEAVHQVVLDGFTPFYLAAVKNHEQVCSKLLAFVKDIFPDALEHDLTELYPSGYTFIHRSLDPALKSQNAEMFQLILKAVKKELGHDYLLDMLITKPKLPPNSQAYRAVESFRKYNSWMITGMPWFSIFDGCRSEKLFNTMAKVVVDRNGVVDYKCLHDLIFQKNGIVLNIFKQIDAENLQGLLSIEGAGPFTKRLLTDGPLPESDNFPLLSSDLLRKFNGTQFMDFVKIITHKDDTIIAKRNAERMLKLSRLRRMSASARESHLNDCVIDELYFMKDADETIIETSFWGHFLRSSLALYYRTFGQPVESIFQGLTYVSDKLRGDCAKELLLHHDDEGYVVYFLSRKILQTALEHLPKESQEEIKKEWKENVPPMTSESFINDKYVRKMSGDKIAEHYSDVLRFYLDYGSEVQLSRCVELITSVCVIGKQKCTVWSCIFEHCELTTTNDILKSVSEIFGWEAVKKLLVHEVDGFPLLLRALSWGDDTDGWLDMVPQEMRNDIQQVIDRKAVEFIDETFRHHETYFQASDKVYRKRLTLLTFVIKYSNAQQREQFVENITNLQVSTRTQKTLSIWAEMLTHPCNEAKTNDVAKMNTFLKCVSEKLGPNAVKELVLHKIDDNPVIYYPALRGEEKTVEAMLAHLDAKNRKKIQRQVNEFLDKTYEAPSFGVITNAMEEAFEVECKCFA